MRLTPLLCHHAVIQRHQPIPIRGWTDVPRARLIATLDGMRAEGISGDAGEFLIWLPARDAGGPFTLTVSTLDGAESVTVSDLMIGEVWLSSGQSNMQMTMQECLYDDVIREAHPGQIRMFTVACRADHAPQQTVLGRWECSTPDTVGQFSAAATFFGNRLREALDVPVGIISSSWGGSFIQTWISREALLGNPITRDWTLAYDLHASSPARWAQCPEQFLPLDPGIQEMGHGMHNSPYMCFVNMIAPLLPVGLAGVIWYQGESNAGAPDAYRSLLQTLISDWRQRFGLGDLPFGIVQLAGFMPAADIQVDSDWARLREAQDAALDLPATGMAVIFDRGHPTDIHPRDKQTVGLRLAAWALADVYGQAGPAGSPRYRGHRVEGRCLRILFRDTGGELRLTDGGCVRTLVIAESGGRFLPAESRIEGDSLVAWHPDIANPRIARYAWADNPEAANLAGATGLPAAPFRTDNPLRPAAPTPS